MSLMVRSNYVLLLVNVFQSYVTAASPRSVRTQARRQEGQKAQVIAADCLRSPASKHRVYVRRSLRLIELKGKATTVPGTDLALSYSMKCDHKIDVEMCVFMSQAPGQEQTSVHFL